MDSMLIVVDRVGEIAKLTRPEMLLQLADLADIAIGTGLSFYDFGGNVIWRLGRAARGRRRPRARRRYAWPRSPGCRPSPAWTAGVPRGGLRYGCAWGFGANSFWGSGPGAQSSVPASIFSLGQQ